VAELGIGLSSGARLRFFACFRRAGGGCRGRRSRLDPPEDAFGDGHAGERAGGRQQSGPERAADDRPDSGNHRQEEADRDAGETGQDREQSFRGDIEDGAIRRGNAQARIPEKSEDDD
jgi:hypothetical protein